MSVWVDSGSRYESEKTNGAANFLGSCAFKGKTAAAIDSIGGIFSATAGREQTVYTAKVFKGDVAKAMEILADSLQAAPEDALINKQRDVLLAKAAATGFDQNIFEHLHETAFMGTGLGQPVFGSEANVKSFSKADLAAYIAGNHTADRVSSPYRNRSTKYALSAKTKVSPSNNIDVSAKTSASLPTLSRK